MDSYKLLTSNKSKLREFQSYGLPTLECDSVPDIKEIASEDPYLVALYKAKEAGPGFLVEDTSLSVDGADIGTNVKWMLENLEIHLNKKCEWRVILAHNDGKSIHLFEGVVQGRIVEPTHVSPDIFGFDAHFMTAEGYTLHELALNGRKNDYSARKRAVEALLNNKVFKTYDNIEGLKWRGAYQ